MTGSLHSWDLTPKQAVELQTRLASQVVLQDDFGEIRTVAGVDLALDKTEGLGFAAVVVFELKSLRQIEVVSAETVLRFPYIPGLLSFREGPILLEAFDKLKTRPDLLFFDGQGIAHPRRFGIASHMGLLLDRPSIGCGKSLLCGTYQEPGPSRGESVPLIDHGETIGAILRTRDHVKPVFVSPGHRISLESAVRFTLQCCDGYRLPKPTRLADQGAAKIKCKYINKLT